MRSADILRKPIQPRLASIECYRVVAILMVVFIHANVIGRLHVVGGAYGYVIDLPLYLVFWISVPFFFLVAGYFYGQRIRAGHDPRALLCHSFWSLLLVFFIWVVVYSVMTRHWVTAFYEQGVWNTLSLAAVNTLASLQSEHIKLLLIPRPPIYHLWFFPALILGLGTVTLVILGRLEQMAASLIVVLYGLTLAAEFIPFDVLRAYPPKMALLAMIFTLLGWWISRQEPVSSSFALWLMAGGYALAFSEGAVLKLVLHASTEQVETHAYAGGMVLVLGIFLFTLAKPTLGQGTILPFLARFTLGVYVSHILIEHTLAPLHERLPQVSAIWHLVYAIVVYGLSVLLTLLLSQIPLVRLAVLRDPPSGRHILPGNSLPQPDDLPKRAPVLR